MKVERSKRHRKFSKKPKASGSKVKIQFKVVWEIFE
jgi:hypothetical protein